MNRIVAKLFRQRIDRKNLFIKKKKKRNKIESGNSTELIYYHKALKTFNGKKKRPLLSAKGLELNFYPAHLLENRANFDRE